MTGTTRRWGFRARLTALIAGVFVLGGAVLLTVQYVLVQQLLASGIRTITGCADGESSDVEIGSEIPGSVVGVVCGGDTIDGVSVIEVSIQQTSYLSNEVLSGLLLWSIVVLVLFAGLAVLAAWWLSKRSLGRIARITDATREITRDDLHRRLDLPGPADEVKELGDTIDGMLDRLDDAFTRQERFAAAASHELRTPLTTTRAALEIPLEQGRFPAEVEPEVRRALAANERSEQLIAALLTLARAGHAPVEPGAVDLVSLVRDALDQHRAEADEHGIAVVLEGSHALVTADETLAGIAVGNLIENAIRHNRDGGTVRITVAEGEHGAELVIENDGRELTAEEAGHLTEPFHRGDQTRLSGPGAGLGLTLADATARSLGGSIALSPRDGGGLTARLTFSASQTP
ncbi:sensor histidine kinase [Brevibacterium picturae]|uniref:histidine kinase n=1 Tax=Brevibacterium picturae TaxID=260553 RepID=A0ABN2CH53_9MICO